MVKTQEQLGFLPTTIWDIGRNSELKLLVGDWMSKESHQYIIQSGKHKGKSHWSTRNSLSEFNPELARRCIELWSKEGDMIVDPFCGRATRGIIAKWSFRNYIGFDIVKKVCDFVRKAEKNYHYEDKHNYGWIKVINADGCKMREQEDESADMIFTCPPYWNIENYKKHYDEESGNQLSDIKDYNKFLKKLDESIKNCYRVLRKDKFCVWVVADFRKDKNYYTFHVDVINLFKKNGFIIWDVIINKLNSMSIKTLSRHLSNNHTAKSHEYILVFKKSEPLDYKKYRREYDKKRYWEKKNGNT